MKLSVIDLGYNSVKLVCYKVNSDGTFRAYDRRSVKTKIGRGLTEGNYLSEIASRWPQALFERRRIELSLFQIFMRRLESHSGYFHTKKNHIILGAGPSIPHVSQTLYSSTWVEVASKLYIPRISRSIIISPFL